MAYQEASVDRAWRRDEIGPGDWLVPLPAPAVEELDRVVESLRRDPCQVLLLRPDDFALSACAAAMTEVRSRLRDGVGLAVVDRVPVERYTEDENRALCWLLGQLLGRPVAQKWDGTVLYDVRDTGQALAYGVRRSVTNLELTFHTDGPWLTWPPEFVGLYCVNRAREGGQSRFLSLVAAHQEMERRHPDLLPRLYRPFPWDRQAEHAPQDTRTLPSPVFEHVGPRLQGRFNEKLIESGAHLLGTPLDPEGQDALDAMREVAGLPELWVEFTIERGQVQYLDNRRCAHSRADFRDDPDPGLRRHLIRLWTREEGRRSFHG